MKFIPMDEKQADTLTKNSNVWWDGWDLMFWVPLDKGKAFTNPAGAIRNGRWGIQTRVPVNTEGKWEVPAKHVRTAR